MSTTSSSSSPPRRGGRPGPGRTVLAEVPVTVARAHRRDKQRSPQENIDEFWSQFTTKAPGKATTIIPPAAGGVALPKKKKAEAGAAGSGGGGGGGGGGPAARTTLASYEEAAAACRAKVAKIVRECRRVNQKYRDPHFDLEFDLKLGRRDCLDSLDNWRDEGRDRGLDVRDMEEEEDSEEGGKGRGKGKGKTKGKGKGGAKGEAKGEPKSRRGDAEYESNFHPKAVKRVVDIFDKPQFYIDGPTANDVRQGRDGDCWLMAALCTLSNKAGLIERVCVAFDQTVGVYGFVFHRDGDWFSEIIDDKLYLTKPDYDDGFLERILWEDRERVNSEEAYRKIYQSNSGALYFAQCENPNETWLPLLEKAYAKAHGDYAAIEGGFTGEGIEDLTGGVTSEIYTTDILDKEYFWKEELLRVNETFLFGCSTGVWGRGWGERRGIVELHAYSVMRAVETDGLRLVLLKNPWGKHEWTGAWSDGSREWTAAWLERLGHTFGNDGSFWISYDDLLRKYQAFDRTRLFGADWKVASVWATMRVPWNLEYNDTKFAFRLARRGPVVLVLAQLDERYFKGLEGQYRFELSFRLHMAGEAASDYLVRSQTAYRMNRGVNVELELDAGEYTVVVKIDAQRNDGYMSVEEVVRANAKSRREKLIRIGLAYDLAHSKGRVEESPDEKAAREALEKRKAEKHKKELRKRLMEERRQNYYHDVKALMKRRKRAEKIKAKRAAKEEKRKVKEEEEEKKMKEEVEAKKAKELEVLKEQEAAAKKATDTKKDEKRPDVEAEPKKDDASKDEGSKKDSESTTDQGDTALTPSTTASEKSQKDVDNSKEPETDEPKDTTPTPTPAKSPKPSVSTEASFATAPESQPEPKEDASSTTAPQAAEDKPNSPPAPQGEASTDTKPPLPKDADATPPPDTADAAIQVPSDTEPSDSDAGFDAFNPFAPPDGFPNPHHGHARQRSRRPGGGRVVAVQREGQRHGGPAARRRGMGPPPPGRFVGGGGGGYMGFNSDSDDSDLESISSVSEISDGELEIELETRRRPFDRLGGGGGGGPPLPPAPGFRGGGSDDEFEKDPWNAVAVVGLRVYYKVDKEKDVEGGEEVVQLRVERPNPYVGSEDEEEEGAKGQEEGKEKVLDVDDSAKDAMLKGSRMGSTLSELVKLEEETKTGEQKQGEEEDKHKTEEKKKAREYKQGEEQEKGKGQKTGEGGMEKKEVKIEQPSEGDANTKEATKDEPKKTEANPVVSFQESTTETAKSEEQKPEAKMVEDTKPEDGKLEQSRSEDSKLEEAKLEDSKREHNKPDKAK